MAHPEVCGEREVLRRAIENVVRNSIRYAPPASEVEVRLESKKHAAQVSVRASTATIALTGTGTQTLSGPNSYAGGTTLSSGQLNINSATAIGTGALWGLEIDAFTTGASSFEKRGGGDRIGLGVVVGRAFGQPDAV